jgi:putative FmdB family regulatory protein
MPIYDYKCHECDNIDTILRKIDDVPELIVCTKCGKTSTRKLTAPGGFTFKGTPFSASSQKNG